MDIFLHTLLVAVLCCSAISNQFSVHAAAIDKRTSNLAEYRTAIPDERPLNLGHRGSSGVYPEHTAPAYSYAIQQGADALECDIQITRDLQLVCLHESWMSDLTNVADIFPEELMNTYFVQDQLRQITDYFACDFTVEELQTIGMKQRYSYRDPHFDGLFPIVSFNEYLDIIGESETTVIVYPEVKDTLFQNGLDFVQEANTTIEDVLIDILGSYGYTESTDPVIIQSFSANSVRYIAEHSPLRVSVLLIPGIQPSNSTLEDYATFAHGIGPNKRLIITANLSNQRTGSTDLVARAHAYGLQVHPWTFRNEDRELLWDYEQDPYNEYMDFLTQEVDGMFTDFPGTLDRLLDSVYQDAQ